MLRTASEGAKAHFDQVMFAATGVLDVAFETLAPLRKGSGMLGRGRKSGWGNKIYRLRFAAYYWPRLLTIYHRPPTTARYGPPTTDGFRLTAYD